MKIKALVAGLAMVAMTSMTANADGYNRFTVGYQAMFLSNSTNGVAGSVDMPTLNGFTADYKHGFGLISNLYVETGLGIGYASGSENYGGLVEAKFSTFNMKIPVNLAYRINLGICSIQPYTGLNLKLNLTATEELTVNGSTAKESYFGEDAYGESLGGKRFQMGWQIGLGFNFSKIYAGIEYGIDFMPLVNYTNSGYYNKVKTSGLNVSVGLSF